MKVVLREIDFGDSCPKGHKKEDVEVVDYEKIDKIDVLTNIDVSNVNRMRKVYVYSGWCKIYCTKCDKEYTVDCYIYEFGKWKRKV